MTDDEEEKILKNLNPKEAVDISTVITTHQIAPNQYFMFRTGGRRKYHGYGQNHSYGYQMPETMEWKGRQVASCLKFTGGLLEGALEQLAAKPDSAPVMTPEERATVTETEFFTYKGWKMLPMAIPPSILLRVKPILSFIFNTTSNFVPGLFSASFTSSTSLYVITLLR